MIFDRVMFLQSHGSNKKDRHIEWEGEKVKIERWMAGGVRKRVRRRHD